MSQHNDQDQYIIPEGLDYPKGFLLWTIPEWVIAFSLFVSFVLINEVMIGLMMLIGTLYFLQYLKQSDTARGHFQHFLWRASILSRQGAFDYAPDPAITRFDG